MGVIFLAALAALIILAVRELVLSAIAFPQGLLTEIYALMCLIASACAGSVVGKYSSVPAFRSGALATFLAFVGERILHFVFWGELGGLPLAFILLLILAGGVIAVQVRKNRTH